MSNMLKLQDVLYYSVLQAHTFFIVNLEAGGDKNVFTGRESDKELVKQQNVLQFCFISTLFSSFGI